MPSRSKAESSKVLQGRKRSSEVQATKDKKISDIFPARRSRGGTQAPANKEKRSKQAEAEPQRKLQSAVPKTLRPEPSNARPPKTPGGGAPEKPAVRKAAPKPVARRYLEEAEAEAVTYRVGDSAYIIMEPGVYGSEEEYEPCEVCARAKKTAGRREIPLLECDRCLRGYHLTCLEPPLPDVPKDAWICPKCAAGAALPPPRSEPRTAREKLMAGTLGLVRIVAIWREVDDSLWFTGRWYILPEEAHTGRQKHHGAREVFLTQQADNNEMELLLRVARVCSPARVQDFDAENEVFVCEYEYDTAWQRFRRLAEEEMDEPDADWAASDANDDSDDESHDGTFKPIYAFWAEKGMVPAKNMRGGGRRRSQARPAVANAGRKRRVQGGDQWTLVSRDGVLGLGASQIPETARLFQGSELCRARALLALTAAPSSLPCREAEREAIARFVREAVAAGPDCLGRCLYVSGVPGTGKTATVLEVMRSFRSPAGGSPHFQFVEINSLRLPTPQHAYTHLYEALTGQYLSPGTALTHLEELFGGGGGGGQMARRRGVTVVLIDEMDLLMTRNQQVLYNLFEWPTRAGSRLAMIGVANTMDLPERLLPRIASRLGGKRTVFQPYSRPQLATIVDARLSEAGLAHTFARNAVNMACSKVAGVSGDVRRVLQLCRKASEVCEEHGCSQVAMEHVNQAVDEMFSAAHMQLLANCCRLEKLLLACLLLELRARGRADAVLEEVVFRLQQLAEVRGEAAVGFGDCLAACHRLAARRLLLTAAEAKRLHMQLSLNVPHDDVVDVLHGDASIPWLKDLHL